MNIMSDDNKQDLNEQKVTLDFTEKELEDYKTYLKFKEQSEAQTESQDIIDDMSESVEEEVTTDDMFDYENYIFTEEIIEQIGYKKYFRKPFGEEVIIPYSENSVLNLLMLIAFSTSFYASASKFDGVFFTAITIFMTIAIIYGIKIGVENIIEEKNSKNAISKCIKYNNEIDNAKWVQIQSGDKKFNRYYNIAKDIINNRLKLRYKEPEFKRDKYTEVYKILGTNLIVVFGIYNFIEDNDEYNVAYMIVLENDEYFLNVINGEILKTKR